MEPGTWTQVSCWLLSLCCSHYCSDYRLECYTDEWTYYMYLAVFGIILYPVGIPAFIFVSLLRHMTFLHYDIEVLEADVSRLQETCDRYSEVGVLLFTIC